MKRWNKYLFALALVMMARLAGAQGFDFHHLIHLPAADTSIDSIEARISRELGTTVILQRTHVRQSPIGRHEQFDMLINNYPMYDGMVKRNVTTNGTTLSYPLFTSTFYDVSRSVERALPQPMTGSRWMWIFDAEPAFLGQVLRVDSQTDYLEIIYDRDGNEVRRRSLLTFAHGDTTLPVTVFRPDPVTVLRTPYGSTLKDYSNTSYTLINNALSIDSLSFKFDESQQVWTLDGPWFKAVDVSQPIAAPPVAGPADQLAEAFTFDRSEPGFEYVNARYHIDAMQRYIQSLGIDNLCNYPLAVDAHGRDSADQSTFFPSETFPRIEFGDGGVDDAEDADVIVHEYGHALSFSASPNTNTGLQRNAIDEGLCDYLALSYSRSLSDFQSDDIFNWDGHNEFWDGRRLTTTRTYPSGLADNIYDDGILWATALAAARDQLGRDVGDQLLLVSLYSHFQHMRLPDAAMLYLQADSALFDAAHAAAISIIFCHYGLLKGCEDTLQVTPPSKNPYLGNTERFAFYGDPLIVYPNDHRIDAVELFHLDGSLAYAADLPESDYFFFELPLTEVSSGMYILRLSTSSGYYSFRLLKHRL